MQSLREALQRKPRGCDLNSFQVLESPVQDRPKGLAESNDLLRNRVRCIANSSWSVEELKARRLTSTKKALKEEKIIIVVDETGDRKKGQKTDYVSRQDLGSNVIFATLKSRKVTKEG